MFWCAGGEIPQVELQLHHGVYFQPLGEVIITGSDWTLCTTFSLVTYEDTHGVILGQIDRVDEHMQNIESQLGDSAKRTILATVKKAWEKLAVAFRRDLDIYSQNLENIKRTVIENDDRESRGLINVVSDVGKYLFGFSTEKDTQDLSKKVDRLASLNQYITHTYY